MALFNSNNLKGKKLTFDDKVNKEPLLYSSDETKIIMAEDINRIKQSVNYSIDSLLTINEEFNKMLNDIDSISSTIINYEGKNIEISSQINVINNKLSDLYENIISANLLKEQMDELTISGRNLNLKIIKINDDFNELSKDYYKLKNSNNTYESFVDEKLKNFEKIINEKLIENNINFTSLDVNYKNQISKIENGISNITNLTIEQINDLLLSANTINLEDTNKLDEFLNEIQELNNNINNI